MKETVLATGANRATVYRIGNEASNSQLTTPKEKRIGVILKNSRKGNYNYFVQSDISRKVYDFFVKNIPSTVNSVLKAVNGDSNFSNSKYSNFIVLLKTIGFEFWQRGHKELLIERGVIIVWGPHYLREVKRFKAQRRNIIYLDETGSM